MYDVICVGSALLDIYLKSDKFRQVKSGDYADGIALCEEFGGKTEVQELEVSSGGAGTNAAVSLARKGLKVALVAEVGKDLVAATIKEELLREGVDLTMLSEVEGEETGMSAILVTPDGGRSALIYRGASKMLTKTDINWEKLDAQWLYISSLGGEMVLLEGLIGHARTKGINVLVNPGMKEIEQLPLWGGVSLFNGVKVLMVNREEAGVILKVNLEDEAIWKSDWRINGPQFTVITDGKNGGRVSNGEEVWWYQPLIVPVVEETGAGDAFGSGLVAALIKGKDIHEAVEWGKRQAASVVSYMGAKKGLLTLDAIAS